MTSVLQFKFRMAKEHNSLLAVGSCIIERLSFYYPWLDYSCLYYPLALLLSPLGLTDLVVFSIYFKYGKSSLSVDFNSRRMSAVTFGLTFHTSNNQIIVLQ